jgi:surfeit locus 1 family protein
MRIPDRRSRFWPTLATVLGVALAVALGNWQLDRGAQKRALKARYDAQAAQPPVHVGGEELDAETMDLRHAETRGVFEPRYAIFIDNRVHRGVPGYHVVMPLKVEGSDRYVLVNRGWIARPPLRSELPAVRTPPGPVTVTGTAMIPGRRTLELSSAVMEGSIWQNLTIERYRTAMPLRIQPFVIRQESALDDGLIRAWDPPDFGIDKHYGYAFQWFALAATLLGFYAVTQFGSRFRRRKRPAP